MAQPHRISRISQWSVMAAAAVCLAAAPTYAQRGGSGGGGHAGGGGGGHASGAAHAGGGGGGEHANAGAASHAGGGRVEAPAASAASAGHAYHSSSSIGQHLPIGSINRSGESTWNGPGTWQNPPATSYPTHVAVRQERWAVSSATLTSSGVNARSRAVNSADVARSSAAAAPAARFNRHRGAFTLTAGNVGVARMGRRIPPFCFFNGIGTLCGSSFGYFGFGYGGFGYPWPYDYDYGMAGVSAQPVDNSETADANLYATYQPGTAPQPLPAEQAEATPLILLVLKDGTIYGVTDYWLDHGKLHYLTSYGGSNTMSMDQLDLQKTVDENWKRGVTFVLRPADDKP